MPVIEVVVGGAECRYRVFHNGAKAVYYESQLQLLPDADSRISVQRRSLSCTPS